MPSPIRRMAARILPVDNFRSAPA
ncbi:23S rRNA (pseudouridine(1915)-N(3))-methyltransferase RlmH, partial [Sinorhizobium meliloti]